MENVIYFDFGERRRPVVSTDAPPPDEQPIQQLLALARSNPGLFLSKTRPSRFLSPSLFRDAVWRANVVWPHRTPPGRDLS